MKIWTIQTMDIWHKLKEEKVVTNTYYSSSDYIQATFWELHLDYVEVVQIFKAR